MQEAPVEVGEVLAGKFRVERILGVGGMGVVVAAMHLHLDKLVALKFMLDGPSKEPEVAARFLREAKAAARLHNQHIAKVLDVGTMDNGVPYMVMEFLDGSDLEQVIKARKADGRGPLPYLEAVDFIMQACLGMAEAHSHRFVHRDLKPPNLFLTRGADGLPLIKILDFGIAKAAVDGIATKTQAIMGSPFYMSPEQWEGARDVDERGDIWALGAILQYLLSGKPPFEGDTLPMLFASIASKEPSSLAGLTNVPKGLQDIVRRCLEKAPSSRPQSVAELASLLVPFGPKHAEEYARKVARVAAAGPDRAQTSDELAGPSQSNQVQGREAAADAYAAGGEASSDREPVNPATTMSRNSGEIASVPSPTVAEMQASHPRKWLPVAGVAAASLAVLSFVMFSGGDTKKAGSEIVGAAAAVEAAADIPGSPPNAEPVPEIAHISFSTEPEGAEVRINGMVKGTSPLELDVEVGSELWLQFNLEGHQSLEEAFVVESDKPAVNFPLVAIVVEPSPSVEPPKASSRKRSKKAGKQPSETAQAKPASSATTKTAKSADQKPGEASAPKQPVIKSTKPVTETIRSSSDRRH